MPGGPLRRSQCQWCEALPECRCFAAAGVYTGWPVADLVLVRSRTLGHGVEAGSETPVRGNAGGRSAAGTIRTRIGAATEQRVRA